MVFQGLDTTTDTVLWYRNITTDYHWRMCFLYIFLLQNGHTQQCNNSAAFVPELLLCLWVFKKYIYRAGNNGRSSLWRRDFSEYFQPDRLKILRKVSPPQWWSVVISSPAYTYKWCAVNVLAFFLIFIASMYIYILKSLRLSVYFSLHRTGWYHIVYSIT